MWPLVDEARCQSTVSRLTRGGSIDANSDIPGIRRWVAHGLRLLASLLLGGSFLWAVVAAERLLLDTTVASLGPAVAAIGFGGGVVVALACFLTLVILDRPSTRGAGAAKALPHPWLLRLQQVNLRTKIVVPTVVLAVLPTGAIGILAVPFLEGTLRDRLVDQLEAQTRTTAFAVESFLQDLHRDLRVVSDLPGLARIADATSDGGRSPNELRALERDLAVFAQGRTGYAQLRLLDSRAHEILRLEAVPGEDRLEPVSSLLEGADPHYESAAVGMEPDEIYVSQLDVLPGFAARESTVLSCATPIEVESGAGRGLLVVNVDPADMAMMFGPMPEGAEAWLVDQNDRYITYVGPSAEKQVRYAMARRRALSEDFGGEALEAIRSGTRVRTIDLGSTLLTTAPLVVDPALPDQRWKLMVQHPLAIVSDPPRRLARALWFGLVLLLSVAALSGVLIAHYVSRPLSLLREATAQIAGGDLSKKVRVTTGDEIEDLARDFNRMTRRLKEAYDRLAHWNSTLKREVAQRTETLQQLQAGLARADRLATVGQMTASVMHEIGNPLAAIKTRVQVAEEGVVLGTETREVLDGVLAEVDRLSAVLRSYSRLGRLGSATQESVDLSDTVEGVGALVAPELERRGITLDVAVCEELPPILGEADRLRQLLINLVLNAAEASERGGRVTVELIHEAAAADGAGGSVAVVVEDEGSGIAPENLEKIWSPFFTTKADGTGLGLPICRQIVEDHGGAMHVRSEGGRGTSIRVTFPAAGPSRR